MKGDYRNYPTRTTKGKLQVYKQGAWRHAVEKECNYCGHKFWTALVGKDKGRFCSKECFGKQTFKRYSSQRPRPKCVVCGTPFEVAPSRVPRVKTCGRMYCHKELAKRVALEKHARGAFKTRMVD